MSSSVSPAWHRPAILHRAAVATAALATLFAPSALFAQAAARSTDEVLVLNPFVVSSGVDKGYRASNSVTGSKVDTPIKDIPMALQAFTEDFIKDVKPTDLYDLVRFSPGVTSQEPGFTAGNTSLSIRGFPTGTNPLRNGTAGPTVIDAANTQRVEIVKGPASFLYGALSPGGIVNVITKRPLSYDRVSFSQDAGSYGYMRSLLDISGHASKGVSFRLVGMYQDDIKYWDVNEVRSSDLAASVNWRILPTLELTLDYEQYTKHEDGPVSLMPTISIGGIFQGFQDLPDSFNYTIPTDFRDTEAKNLGVESNLKLGEHWAVRGNFGYNHLFNVFRAAGGGAIPGNPAVIPATAEFAEIPAMYAFNRRYNETGRDHHDYTYQADLVGNYKWNGISARIIAGYQYTRNSVRNPNRQVDSSKWPRPWDLRNPATWNRSITFTDAEYVLGGDQIGRGTTEAYYGGVTLGLFEDRLLALAGSRHTENAFQTLNLLTGVAQPKFTSTADSPQIGLLYKLTPSVNAYVSYSKSFVPNNTMLRLNQVPVTQAVPTYGKGYEAGFKAELFDKKLSTTVSVYEITNTNIIQTLVSNTLQSDFQSGENRSKGIEFDVSYAPTSQLQLYASYAYTDAIITENPSNVAFEGLNLLGSSKHLANAWVRYDFTQGKLRNWYVAGGASYAGPRTADLRNPNFKLTSYVLVSATIGHQFKAWKKSWNVEVAGKNLLGEEYTPYINARGRPRTLQLSVSTNF